MPHEVCPDDRQCDFYNGIENPFAPIRRPIVKPLNPPQTVVNVPQSAGKGLNPIGDFGDLTQGGLTDTNTGYDKVELFTLIGEFRL